MTPTFDPERLLEALHRHDVSFVLIGGLAAVARGSPLPTTDVDVTPDRSAENLDRLAAALRELEARIRTAEPEGVVFPIDAEFLAAQPRMLNLVTSAGDLDIAFTPAGFEDGYSGLIGESDRIELVAGTTTQVAGLAAIIRSKEVADREKDRRALPYLRALLDETGQA
jgi:hypothetical protein